jgi:hypothetical protein
VDRQLTLVAVAHSIGKVPPREAVMAGFETRGKRDPTNFHRRRSDRGFLVAVVIAGIGLIILSIGLGVGISPEASMLAAP